MGDQKLDFESVTFDPLFDALTEAVKAKLVTQKKQVDERAWIEFEKYITLNIVDSNWKDHLLTMDHLKEGISLRGMAGKNPLNEYKKEGMGLFNAMSERIREDTVSNLFHMQIRSEEEARLQEREERAPPGKRPTGWLHPTARPKSRKPLSEQKRRWAVTIHALAGRAKNIKSATARRRSDG